MSILMTGIAPAVVRFRFMDDLQASAKRLQEEYKNNRKFRETMILSAKSGIDDCFAEMDLSSRFDCMILAERAMDRVMGK